MKKKRVSVLDKAESAIKQAVDDVIENHIKLAHSLKVSRESIEKIKNPEPIFRGDKKYIISQYNSKRYFVAVVSKSNIVPVFPFTSKKAAQEYINSCEKKKKKKK